MGRKKSLVMITKEVSGKKFKFRELRGWGSYARDLRLSHYSVLALSSTLLIYSALLLLY